MLKLLLPTLLFIPLLSYKNIWRITPSLMFFSCSIASLNFLPFQTSFSPMKMFSFDHLSTPLIMLTLWVTALMVSTSLSATPSNPTPSLTYMSLLLSATLLVCFSVNNLMLFYILFEASLIPTLLLILVWGYQPDRLLAGMYMMMYTITASLPLLLGLLLLSSNNLHLNLTFLNWHPPMFLPPPLWWAMCSIAFLTKIPMYSLHLWLPKAHVEAPVAGSMILASILLKLGGYGLLRISSLFQTFSLHLSAPLLSISLWGATLTGVICLRQPDLKALIAYSSVAHMGLMIAGFTSMTSWGWNAALTIMLAHGLCSSALFALTGMTYETTNTRSLFLTKGLLTLAPTMTMWWFMFSASNMAAPPSTNLLGELVSATAVLSKTQLLAPLIMLSSFFAAAYSLHLYTATQHGPLPQYFNPMTPPLSSHLTTLLLHLLPLILLILKPELICAWI